MSHFSVNIMCSDSISEELRLHIEDELSVEGVDVLSSNDQLIYESFGTAPENIIIECLGFVGLAFASGFAAKAGADAWDALKSRFRNIRKIHQGGLEIEFLDGGGSTLVRYVIPRSSTDAAIALEQISSDFEKLTKSDEMERWWLGSPHSRWGTGLESIEVRSQRGE